MKPLLWDTIAVGTTITEWVYKDYWGIGTVHIDATTGEVVFKTYCRWKDRQVTYG